MKTKYKRPIYDSLFKRFKEQRKFIQVLTGPRQTGKTTLAWQLMEGLNLETHYASADEPALKDASWMEQQWEIARLRLKQESKNKAALLVLDEIQKIPQWSETVKRLWDEDTMNKLPLHVLILGSSALLIRKGLSESLTGRFETTAVTHWSFYEMEKAFNWSVENFIFYGGYPGAVDLIEDRERWSRYIVDSLIETTISRDILLMTRVDKPALLRRLFELGCAYSGQILSYHKMLGQLHDAGNTTTLAHYLTLLESAGMIAGINKYSSKKIHQRASSPKLVVLNTALMTAPAYQSLNEVKTDTKKWGRLVESAIGAVLFNGLQGSGIELYYWLDRNREVDYILSRGNDLAAIEVKSGLAKTSLPGIETFSKLFQVKKKLLVGPQGIPVKDFLLTHPVEWLK